MHVLVLITRLLTLARMYLSSCSLPCLTIPYHSHRLDDCLGCRLGGQRMRRGESCKPLAGRRGGEYIGRLHRGCNLPSHLPLAFSRRRSPSLALPHLRSPSPTPSLTFARLRSPSHTFTHLRTPFYAVSAAPRRVTRDAGAGGALSKCPSLTFAHLRSPSPPHVAWRRSGRCLIQMPAGLLQGEARQVQARARHRLTQRPFPIQRACVTLRTARAFTY